MLFVYFFFFCFRNLIQPSCRQGVCFSPSLDLGLTDLEMGHDDPIYDEPWDMVRPPLFPAFDIEYEVNIVVINIVILNIAATMCRKINVFVELFVAFFPGMFHNMIGKKPE